MKVALILPTVAAVCAVEVTRRSLWLAWPILGMIRAVLRPEPVTAESEGDYLA